MAPVTFHGGPLNGHTVEADAALVDQGGAYRLDGLSAIYSAPDGAAVQIRPAAPVETVAPTVGPPTVEAHEQAHAEAVQTHRTGERRKVTRR